MINGITAWQMLHHTARLRSGPTILAPGANGGVRTVLVQLAGPRASTRSTRHTGATTTRCATSKVLLTP